MEAFATLLERLYYTHSTLAKAALLEDYFARTPDPDRGYAVAALAGTLSFELFKRHVIRDVVAERVDPVLFDLSRDYVGETSETVAHIWPVSENAVRLNRLPPLHEVIERFTSGDKTEIRAYLVLLLDNLTPEQRWALLKLGTGSLRVGVSARFIKNVLAQYGGKEVGEVENVWHGVEPPYTALFAWLEGKAEKPDLSQSLTFHPVMLSHAIEEDELGLITPELFAAEWKYDGIRVQLVASAVGVALYSRTGDDIGHSFPDLLESIDFHAVLDGELLVRKDGIIAPFNDLQQRLNKKLPGKKLIETCPAFLMVYDMLEADGVDFRPLSFLQRREALHHWFEKHHPERMQLSALLSFDRMETLARYRSTANRKEDNYIEGLMLKRKSSPYIPGRPKGHWYKWKRDPLNVDAVLMLCPAGLGQAFIFLFRLHIRPVGGRRDNPYRQSLFRLYRRGIEKAGQLDTQPYH